MGDLLRWHRCQKQAYTRNKPSSRKSVHGNREARQLCKTTRAITAAMGSSHMKEIQGIGKVNQGPAKRNGQYCIEPDRPSAIAVSGATCSCCHLANIRIL